MVPVVKIRYILPSVLFSSCPYFLPKLHNSRKYGMEVNQDLISLVIIDFLPSRPEKKRFPY